MFFKLLLVASIVLIVYLKKAAEAACDLSPEDLVNDELYVDVHYESWPKTIRGQCHFACMLRETNLLTSGPFDTNHWVDTLRPRGMPEIALQQLINITTVCKDINEGNENVNERCKTAGRMLQCFSEGAVRHGINPKFLAGMIRETFERLTEDLDENGITRVPTTVWTQKPTTEMSLEELMEEPELMAVRSGPHDNLHYQYIYRSRLNRVTEKPKYVQIRKIRVRTKPTPKMKGPHDSLMYRFLFRSRMPTARPTPPGPLEICPPIEQDDGCTSIVLSEKVLN